MQGLADKMREQRRLAILQALAEDARRALNDETLGMVLQVLMLGVTRDVIRADIDWLNTQQLVSVEQLTGIGGAALLGVTLRHEGLETATGLRTFPGIARPGLR